MSVMGLFFLCIFSVAALWLWGEGVTESPWLQEGEMPAFRAGRGRRPSAGKLGLVVFLAVALCLFSLLSAAFFMRMGSPDWRSPSLPRILWFNTFFLGAGSVALQIASSAAKAGETARVRAALAVGGVCSVVFLFGQLWAWRDMVAAGFYASANPANAFFFLLTGAHALHLLGGLVALALTIGRVQADIGRQSSATSVELCAIYWHFLLGVWLLLLILLVGWADNLGAICRRLLS
jgi:cytochrome c oxidase subunit III